MFSSFHIVFIRGAGSLCRETNCTLSILKECEFSHEEGLSLGTKLTFGKPENDPVVARLYNREISVPKSHKNKIALVENRTVSENLPAK